MKKYIFIILTTFLFAFNVKAKTIEEIIKSDGIKFTCVDDQLFINDARTGTKCNAFNTSDYDSLYYYVYGNYVNVSTKPAVYATGNYPSSYHSYGIMNIPGSTKATFQYFDGDSPWFSTTGLATNTGTTAQGWMGTNGKLLDYIYTNTNIYKYDSSNSPTFADTSQVLFLKNAISKTPTISITEASEEKTTVQDQEYLIAVNLNVESTNIDDSKYICMFSFDDRETWDKFNCSEEYSYKATNNGNYYAQIVSKEDDSVISSTTYTITKIQTLPSSNPKVDIEITKKTNNQTDFIAGGSCIINKNNNTYTQCEDINIKFSLIDESILKYEYSYDKQNWINFNFNLIDKLNENNTISMRVYKNATLYVRVINLDNNEINNSATYTISSINATEILKQEVTFQSVYYRDLMKIDVYSLFINYDSKNYNYYFNTSADKNSFVDITNKIVCSANTGCRYITSFDYSGVVYIRIEDKQGNYINTFTYTVNYDHYLEKKNVTDYMNDVPKFMESMKNYISKFTDVINYFFTNLNSTIKYAIITLFIVLIATCIIRMGKK